MTNVAGTRTFVDPPADRDELAALVVVVSGALVEAVVLDADDVAGVPTAVLTPVVVPGVDADGVDAVLELC